MIDDDKVEIDWDTPSPARCANGVQRTPRERELSLRSFDNCTIHDPDGKIIELKREYVIEFALEHFDYNKDKKIDKDECDTAMIKMVPWAVRQLVPACSEIFKRCDCDGNNILDVDDFLKSPDTCLGHCKRIKMAYRAIVFKNFGPDEDGDTLK
jgi:hypothetical protein